MDKECLIPISVIVPIYNVEMYLEKCLSTLAKQTMPFKEIILVNDGSEDGSKMICEEYCKKYDNFVLINQSNKGPSAARNMGMRYAEGEYLLFVDADDYVMLHMNEYLQGILKEGDVDILYYNADIMDEVGVYWDESRYVRNEFLNGCIMSGIEYLDRSFPDQYIVVPWVAVFKKAFLYDCNIVFPCGLFYEDNLFFMQTIMNAKQVLSISEHLYVRRVRFNSTMMQAVTERKQMDYIEVNLLIWEDLLQNFNRYGCKDLYRKYIVFQSVEVFRFLEKDINQEIIYNKAQFMCQRFLEYWLCLFESNLTWNEIYILQLILNFAYGHVSEDKQLKCARIIDKAMKKKLKILPLGDRHKRIGIYGTGKHTENLCALYEKYVGSIFCDAFFIETKKKAETFWGRKVVCCADIPCNTDMIIVSSRIYKEEMVNELVNRNIEKEKIVTLYDKEDKFDIVVIGELLRG